MSPHAEVADALDRLSAPIGAAESHGILCAMHIGGLSVDAQAWAAEVFGPDDRTPEVAGVFELDNLYRTTVDALTSEEFEFEPLLPDDDCSLGDRCEAIADWNRGFLYGLGISAGDIDSRLTDEAREVLSDMSAMTQLGSEGAGESESDYMEIVEYLRMGVILLREELRERPPRRSEMH